MVGVSGSGAAVTSPAGSPRTVAAQIAAYLHEQRIERVFSLPGSHMKPIWAALHARGVEIVSVRHEVAAVHMAQAHADLAGRLAVAIVTTGPGLTNAVTGIACARLAGSPVLVISTRPPTEQAGMGALEEIDQAAVVRPLCRTVEVVMSGRHVLDRLDRAVSSALGEDGPSGPAYVELATELLREPAARPYAAYPRRTRARRPPAPESVALAADLISACSRPLVISGREVLDSPDLLRTFVEQTGALYLDTRASRGSLSDTVASFVPAARARAMAEADLVITLGLRLDFEVAYGSPAVFEQAQRFLRVGRGAEDVQVNRRGDVELRADVRSALEALVASGAEPRRPDSSWREDVMGSHADKRARLAATIAGTDSGPGAALHPYELLRALDRHIGEDAIVIVDGGDILSWSRAALRAPTYLDVGPFGCLGVGVPYAIAASLLHPDRQVVLLTGDGALGLNVMELETAVRTGAGFVVVVANNSAWNIERNDQVLNYDGEILGTELGPCAFDRLAESVGVPGWSVQEAAALGPALTEAFEQRLALVDVRVSREPLSPDTRSGLALVPDYQVLSAWDDAERAWRARPAAAASSAAVRQEV